MSETKVSRILNRDAVEAGEPCYEYRQRFAERFPESVEVTVELAVSQAEDWDWYWAANALLSYEGRIAWNKVTDTAEAQYDDTVRPYQDAQTRAYGEYDKVYNSTLREGERLLLSWKERYDRADRVANPIIEVETAALTAVRKVASKRLNEARARAWSEIYISETDEQTAVQQPEDDEVCDCWSCREDRESW